MAEMDIDNFEHKKGEINSRDELFHFLKLLAHDYRTNRQNWENITIDSYLESIVAWCEDSLVLNDNDRNWKEKPWTCIAELFHAGKYYE